MMPGLPLNASEQGLAVDHALLVVHLLMAGLFLVWFTMFTLNLLRSRRPALEERTEPASRWKWPVFMAVAVGGLELGLLFGVDMPAWRSRAEALPPDSTSVVVRVVAEQYAWNIHYPGADRTFGRTDRSLVSTENPLGLDPDDPAGRDDITTINELVLPVGRPVIVRLTTKDVIHSFSLPLFRVKQDAIPGQQVSVWFRPTLTSDEMRGLMTGTVDIPATGVPQSLLGAVVSMEDYRDSSGVSIVGRGAFIGEEDINRLRAAGIHSVRVAPDSPAEIACAQLCGLGHYRMRGSVSVLDEARFEQWCRERAPGTLPQ